MAIAINASFQVPSQCDAQKHFMQQAEMEFGSPKAIALAISLVEEEVNKELLPAVKQLLQLESESAAGVPEEELQELYEATLVEIADGIVDSVYVLFQLANTLNLPFDKLFELVHTNNMSKIQKDADGKLLKREDGKLLKPEGYKKPDIRGLLFPAVTGEAVNDTAP